MTNIDPFFFGDMGGAEPTQTPAATTPVAPADPFDIYVPERFPLPETTTPEAPDANVPQETPAERRS